MQEVAGNENLLKIREVTKKLIAEQLVESSNFHIQNYHMLMLGCHKGTNGWETQINGKDRAKKTG